MKLIVTGIDGCGKTTIVNKILRMFPNNDIKLVHCDRRTPNDYKFFKSLLENEHDIIFDRFCYEQFVYQDEEERKRLGGLNQKELIQLEEYMREHGVIVLYVKADVNKCLENCLKDDEDKDYTYEYLSLLQKTYDELMFSPDRRCTIFSYINVYPY